MTSLILKTSGIIKNPAYGKLPDLKSDLRFELDARNLALSEGDSVTKWVSASGEGSLEERTFTLGWSTYNHPLYRVNNGVPSVNFYGNEALYNSNLQYSTVEATYVIVARIDDLNPSAENKNYPRLFSGRRDPSTDKWTYHSIAPYNSGVQLSTGDLADGYPEVDGSTRYSDVIPIDNDLCVMVYVVNGANSRFISSFNNVMVTQNLVQSKHTQTVLGTSESRRSDSKGEALKGGISYIAQYARALTDAEVFAIFNHYKSEFSVA